MDLDLDLGIGRIEFGDWGFGVGWWVAGGDWVERKSFGRVLIFSLNFGKFGVLSDISLNILGREMVDMMEWMGIGFGLIVSGE